MERTILRAGAIVFLAASFLIALLLNRALKPAGLLGKNVKEKV